MGGDSSLRTSAPGQVLPVDAARAGFTREVRFDSSGEPVYAMMVTGGANRRAFAVNAIVSFLAQTYGNRHLVIVNHGDYRFEVAGAAAERVIQVRAASRLSLGALRNLALERIPDHALWVQWDDDDWRHPALIDGQRRALSDCGADACLLRWQVKYSFARNAAWADLWLGGFAGTLMTRNFPDIRYPDVGRSEDSAYGGAVKRRYRHCDWDNPAEYYIRFLHGRNTWPDDHFGLADRAPDEWRVSPEAAAYLRATLSLYAEAAGAARPGADSATPSRGAR